MWMYNFSTILTSFRQVYNFQTNHRVCELTHFSSCSRDVFPGDSSTFPGTLKDSLAVCLCCVLICTSLFSVQSPQSIGYTRELNEEKSKIPTQKTNCEVKLNAVNPPQAQLKVQRQQQGSETQVSYKWNILASFSSWVSFWEHFKK